MTATAFFSNGNLHVQGHSSQRALESLRELLVSDFQVPERQVVISPRGFFKNKVYDLSAPGQPGMNYANLKAAVEQNLGIEVAAPNS